MTTPKKSHKRIQLAESSNNTYDTTPALASRAASGIPAPASISASASRGGIHEGEERAVSFLSGLRDEGGTARVCATGRPLGKSKAKRKGRFVLHSSDLAVTHDPVTILTQRRWGSSSSARAARKRKDKRAAASAVYAEEVSS
jgi:hypothetical protein